MHRALLLATVLFSLVHAGEANAVEIVVPDDEGRSIRFDVRAQGVDVEWYAALLRASTARTSAPPRRAP